MSECGRWELERAAFTDEGQNICIRYKEKHKVGGKTQKHKDLEKDEEFGQRQTQKQGLRNEMEMKRRAETRG